MLTINHYHKLAHKKVSGVNGVMYKVTRVIETDNFYTFQMYSTETGFSEAVRLYRHSDELNWEEKVPVYKFMDCDSVMVTAEWIKDMDNLINSIESVIKIKTHNPNAMKI